MGDRGSTLSAAATAPRDPLRTDDGSASANLQSSWNTFDHGAPTCFMTNRCHFSSKMGTLNGVENGRGDAGRQVVSTMGP